MGADSCVSALVRGERDVGCADSERCGFPFFFFFSATLRSRLTATLLLLAAHQNVFFSFATIISGRSPKFHDLLRAIEPNRLLLESDYTQTGEIDNQARRSFSLPLSCTCADLCPDRSGTALRRCKKLVLGRRKKPSPSLKRTGSGSWHLSTSEQYRGCRIRRGNGSGSVQICTFRMKNEGKRESKDATRFTVLLAIRR